MKFEIRNSKVERRSKVEIQNSKLEIVNSTIFDA